MERLVWLRVVSPGPLPYRKPRMTAVCRLIALTLLAIMSALGPANTAINYASPEAFIDGLGAEVIAVLADKTLDQQKRELKFREVLNASFDAETTGRVVLGRYWGIATEQERERFQPLYREYLIRIDAARFSRFSGEKFVVKGVRRESDGDLSVQSEIQPPAAGGPTYQVNWRVRQEKGVYRIVDVIADGVSLLVTHNQEFSSIIQNGGGKVQSLLDALQARAGRTN